MENLSGIVGHIRKQERCLKESNLWNNDHITSSWAIWYVHSPVTFSLRQFMIIVWYVFNRIQHFGFLPVFIVCVHIYTQKNQKQFEHWYNHKEWDLIWVYLTDKNLLLTYKWLSIAGNTKARNTAVFLHNGDAMLVANNI